MYTAWQGGTLSAWRRMSVGNGRTQTLPHRDIGHSIHLEGSSVPFCPPLPPPPGNHCSSSWLQVGALLPRVPNRRAGREPCCPGSPTRVALCHCAVCRRGPLSTTRVEACASVHPPLAGSWLIPRFGWRKTAGLTLRVHSLCSWLWKVRCMNPGLLTDLPLWHQGCFSHVCAENQPSKPPAISISVLGGWLSTAGPISMALGPLSPAGWAILLA